LGVKWQVAKRGVSFIQCINMTKIEFFAEHPDLLPQHTGTMLLPGIPRIGESFTAEARKKEDGSLLVTPGIYRIKDIRYSPAQEEVAVVGILEA
jgi:hypothetical protein